MCISSSSYTDILLPASLRCVRGNQAFYLVLRRPGRYYFACGPCKLSWWVLAGPPSKLGFLRFHIIFIARQQFCPSVRLSRSTFLQRIVAQSFYCNFSSNKQFCKIPMRSPPYGNVECRWCMKKSPFSTNISFYIGNDTI